MEDCMINPPDEQCWEPDEPEEVTCPDCGAMEDEMCFPDCMYVDDTFEDGQ